MGQGKLFEKGKSSTKKYNKEQLEKLADVGAVEEAKYYSALASVKEAGLAIDNFIGIFQGFIDDVVKKNNYHTVTVGGKFFISEAEHEPPIMDGEFIGATDYATGKNYLFDVKIDKTIKKHFEEWLNKRS